MTTSLYLKDCYLLEFSASVVSVNGAMIELSKSAFYPNSGGQPGDTGVLLRGEEIFKVLDTIKNAGKTMHVTDHEGLAVGDCITGEIEMERRFRHMRMHTAAHMLSGIISKETGAEITGNQLGMEKSRIDFSLAEFDREKLTRYVEKANVLIEKKLPVHIKTLPREEAFAIPSLFKLRKVLPEHIQEIRIIDIEGFDMQACGGTHVKNIGEIGKITIMSVENKGKENRRLYFTLS